MWTSFTQHISIRLALIMSLVAVIVVAINTVLIFNRTYDNELIKSKRHATQLVETVINTSAVALYLHDNILAKEVVDGLKKNDLINSVVLRTNQKVLAEAGDSNGNDPENTVRYNLYSPFDKTEMLGFLEVTPNQAIINSYAKSVAKEFVILMVTHSFLLILFVLFIVHNQLIKAVKAIASNLHKISPGNHQRIDAESLHKHDEIGMLASDINQLLDSVELTFNRERELRKEVEVLEQRFRGIFEQASGGIALLNYHGQVKVHNPSFELILGEQRMERVLSNKSESLAAILDSGVSGFQGAIDQVLLEGTAVSIDIQLADLDAVRWVHCLISKMNQEHAEPMLEVIMHDISERRFREQSFQIQAERDPLTGLYNRRAGQEKVQALLDKAVTNSQRYALLMLDLDNFKPINDTYGHDAGDQVLVRLAEKLQNTIRSDDILVRWGGDEFLIFIKQSHLRDEASHVAVKLLDMIQEPIVLDDLQQVEVGVSIGIAVYPDHGFDFDLLLQRADKAMYKIKSEIKGSFVFYDDWKFNSDGELEH